MRERLVRLGSKLFSNWKVCGFNRATRTHALRSVKSVCTSPQILATYRFCSSSGGYYSEAELVEFNQKATTAFKEGDYDEAIQHWEAVARSKNHSEGSPAAICCLNNLASAYGRIGENMRKIELLEKACQVARRVYGSEHLQYALALYNLASAKEEVGMYEDMRCCLEESLAVHERRFNPKNIKLARILLLLANAHEKLGEPEAQLNKAERAFEITKHHYGAEHIQTTIALMTLGRACGANNQPEQHLKLVQRAFSIQENRLGSTNPQLALGLLELAKAHAANRDYEKQKELLEQAVSVQGRAHAEQPTYLVETYLSLGDAHAQLKDEASMAYCYNEALKIARRGDGNTPVVAGRAVTRAALGNLQQGNLAQARRLAAEAADLLSAISPNHPLTKDLAEIKKMLAAKEKSDKHG